MARGAQVTDTSPSTAAPTWRPSRRVLAVLVAAYWAYVVNGMVNSEIGPALLGMVHSFHIGLGSAGAIFTAQFVGYLPGALCGGIAADRWGYRRVLIPAALLTGCGTAGVALVGSWPVALALTTASGLGFGMTDSLCNAVVAAESPREGGAAFNLLHTFFGVGALIGPLLVAAFLSTSGSWNAVFLITGALACSCMVLFMLVPIPLPPHLRPKSLSDQLPVLPVLDAAEPESESSRGTRRLWLLSALLFLFVGMEQLVGGWSSEYLHRVIGASLEGAARSVSIYWAAVTIGRLLASALALRLSKGRVLGGSAALALFALALLAITTTVGPAFLALGATGLGFAAIYPTIMAITAEAYPRRFATLAGAMVACGGLGGAIFPWVGGIVGETWGLRATIWLGAAIAAAVLGLVALLLYGDRTGKR